MLVRVNLTVKERLIPDSDEVKEGVLMCRLE